jgi:hypothetical protein
MSRSLCGAGVAEEAIPGRSWDKFTKGHGLLRWWRKSVVVWGGSIHVWHCVVIWQCMVGSWTGVQRVRRKWIVQSCKHTRRGRSMTHLRRTIQVLRKWFLTSHGRQCKESLLHHRFNGGLDWVCQKSNTVENVQSNPIATQLVIRSCPHSKINLL